VQYGMAASILSQAAKKQLNIIEKELAVSKTVLFEHCRFFF
jgi:hypothetical protein